MSGDKEMRQIALQVSIALVAGMFSIVPVAYGAPTGGQVVKGGAVIGDPVANTTGGNDISITSTTRNNVIDWQDFSVAAGEKVVFDGGTKDPAQGAHNYMNIVTGGNTSQINGAIKGGNEVYIINPNGVIFGETASVDVGSLYASTRAVTDTVKAAIDADGTSMESVINTAPGGVAMDIVNMGTIKADKVVMEGKNVRFINDSSKTNDGGTGNSNYATTGVTAASVLLKAEPEADGYDGYIHVGNVDGSNNGYTGQNLLTGEAITPTYYKLIGNDNWSTITSSGKYMLKEDITAANFSQIPSFGGSFDGNYYEIKEISGVSGVFAATNGAEIYNVGVSGATISAGASDYAGAIVADATNTVLKNVYNNGSSVSASFAPGGLVGKASGVKIYNSYNTGNIESPENEASGLIGLVYSGTNIIEDSYSTGTARYGISQTIRRGATLTADRVYTKGGSYFSSISGTANISNLLMQLNNGNFIIYPDGTTQTSDVDNTALATYQSERIAWGDNISNTGGVKITGDTVTRPTWRIYEGQSAPVLTSFLKGVTTVNYDYTHGSQSGSNRGADLTATSPVTITDPDDGTISAGVLTYNGSYMNVDSDSIQYGGGANPSLMSYSNSSPDGVRNAKTKALFHSTQNGYDIVGGNVTMAKRQVTVEGTDLNFSHVYDGATDVTAEFQTAFSSSSGTGTAGGILAEDVGSVGIGFSNDFSANFVDKNVGENKRINLTGSLELTGSGDIRDNYELAASSANLSTTTVTGTITQRPIYLTVTEPTDDRLNKTYNGNNAVNSSVSASDIFSLDDGTTYAVGTQNPGYGKITGDNVSLDVGDSAPTYVDVDTAGNITNTNAVYAGPHKILFSGIALTGNDAGNYKLQYRDTQTDVTNSQVFMDGVIRPRLLAADGFQVRIPTGETDSAGNIVYTTAAANKTYDGTSTYNVPDNAVLVANTGSTTGDTGMLAADTENLWFDLSSGTRSYFKDSSGNETDMAGGANAATQVAYAVDAIGPEALKNSYTFYADSAASNTPGDWITLNSSNGIPTVGGAGTISRRNITIAVSNAENINKPYDGNANVVGTGYTTMGGTYLNYVDGSDKLLMNDADAIANADATLVNGNINAVPDSATWNISAAYTDKNVAREADGSVADNGKTVNFVIAITGDDAVNYTLNGQNAETYPVTLTGTGKITPVALTPTFAAIEKTYNGTNRIDDSDSTATGVGTVTGLTYTDANGNEVTDNVSVTYQSGYSAANAYYVSEDYNGNAGENLAVYYPHLTLTGTDAVNYDLASTTGEGTGAINRRTILSNGFQVLNNGTAADGSKVYDGTDIYELPDGATLLADTTASGNTGVISRDQDNLWFTLSDNADSYFTNSAGTTRTSKVADASRIAYQAGAVTRTGYEYLLNNYKIGANEASAVNLTADGTYSVFGNGHIDRRAINIDINNAANINKEYNADTDLVGAGDINIGGAYLNYTDDSAETSKLLADDSTATAAGVSDTAAWSVSAAYDNKNVVRDADGNVIDNGKTVNFNISITGDDAANYTLNGVNAETTGAAPITLTGTGKITPKELTASFSPVSKIYNGTTRINDQDSSVTGNGTVTPLPGDTVTLNNYNADDAYYDTPDVGTDKTVYYPNLTLTGADSGNYKLSSTIGLGTGRIDTATVTLDDFVFDFAGVNRVYNGETAVADSAQGITADQFITDSYIDLGTGTFDFRNYIRNLNANYANKDVNANTGAGNVTYSFTLADMTIPNISITGDYQNYFANNPVTRSVGTITPKTVYATINNPVVTKTYNGAYDVQNYTAPLVSYSGLVGDSADASTAVYLDKNQGTDKLVQYDVAISDGSNYVIKYNSVDDAANMATYRTAANGPVVTADDVITTVVTPNNVINPKDVRLTFADVTKQYDGTTSVQPVADQVALGATTMSGVESGDTITLTGWNAVYNSPDVLTANTVSYSNITLSGNDNGNYNFIDANGNSLNANTVIDGNGAITPLTLSGTYAFTLGDVTKEYDSTNAIKFTGTGTDGNEYYRDSSAAAIKNFITAPSLTINGASRQMGYELDMGNTGYNGTTVGEHPATFRVGISNSNYTFDSITVTDGTNTLTPTVENGVYYYNLTKNNATIIPRKVYVALNDNPAITKVYDGTNAVEQVVTGNNNKVYLRDSTDFISGDNVDVDWNNISAVYSSENVAYDGEGNVTSQDVIYNVGLTGTDAGNYVLYRAADNTAITDANKLTGTGIITPRELTVDFARDEHIFDNSAYLTNPGSNLQLGNLANRDAGFELDSIAKAAIGGRYTDKNVNRADDGTVLDKGLTYNNLQNALADYATRNAIAKNYIMPVDSVTYSVDDAKGVIKPLEITDPLKAVWQENVNKTYDATANLPTGTDANSVLTLQVNTAYDGNLTLQADDNGYQYDVNTVGYVSKNQGDRALTYTVTGVNPNQGNYQLSDSVVNAALAVPWVSTEATRNMDGNAVTGHISPRTLTIVTENDSKIYNGETDVANAKSKIHFTDEDQAIINNDTDAVDYTVTANYRDKNADEGITIDYTLTLTGNDNGNYVLNSGTGTAVGTTTGDIAKRKVYVEPVDVDGIDKVYDKTTDLPDGFTNTGRFKLADTGDTTGIVAGEEDIQLDFDAIQGEYDSEHAGLRTITFNNFNLVDTNLLNDDLVGNYTLETSSIDGSGTISPKGLVVGINAAPTKEYDTFNNISDYYAGVDNLYLRGESAGEAGVIGDDQVNLQVNSANYATRDAGVDKEYSYGISIDNTDYKLVQGNNLPTITVSNDGQSGTVTAYDGEITKRKVYVSLADTPNIVKTYDGNTGVIQDVTNKIIVRDGDLLDDGTKLNRDADVINAHYDFKDAGDRNVIYNAQLKGSAAGNYEIHQLSNINDTAADVESSTLVGTGIINKAKLTLDPATMSKTYNGTALIGDGKSAGDDAWTPDKLVFKGVNNESFTLTDEAFAKVIGQYGYGKGDANVSWAGDEVAYKDVQYTGLSDALAVMNADASTNEISKNYTIDNTAVFDAAQAKGKINPITITQAAKENWKPVIREYNADTDLSEVYDYSSGTPGQQLGINDILTLTVMDADGNPLTIDYTATGNYDHKNVGGTHVLNYHIDSVNKKVNDGKGEGNYVLDTSVLDALQDKNLDSAAEQVYSVITPRQLNAEVLKATDNRKIYDGTADADTGNFVLDKADQAILSQDNLLNNVVITAYYDNENASIAPDGEAANSKTITYTLGLNDDSGNYQIATPTAEALGDIEQRRVYVAALDVNNIDKIYDGTTAVPDGYTRDGRFALTAADESTGIVAGDEDILLNTDAISGQYASAHVQRDADGRPTAQTVRFSNFTLRDANAGNNNHAGNYYVATDSLQGSGTITPKGLTVGIKEAPVKVYDGETALASTYAANDNLVLEGLVAGDNANLLIDSAAYADANAGKNKEYSYQISLGNDDYELVQGTDKPALTVTDNGQSGTVTAQDGTITPRTLTASVIQDMTKVYDGTTDGAAMENPEDYILLSNNYLAKDKDSLGLTAVAVFDGANAGKSEDTDELEQHKVTYTLNLANTNYELADNTVTGEGTIYRKGLNIVAEPVSVLAGDKMPVFSGTVEGLLPSESGLADLFSFAPDSTTTTNVPGSYAVYGWYNNRFSGNLGQNYSFAQDAKNETAFTVGYLDNTGNPDLKFTPTRNIYQQISKDMGSGFGDNGMAAIEYVNKDGQIVGREMVDSGEIHGGSNASMSITGVDSNSTNLANIGISGGDVVNMEGADAASLANIEVDGDGSIVNLQVMPVDGEQSADGRSSAAEIVAADETGNVHNSSASIQIVDDSGNVLEKENEDKVEKQKKKGNIAIESEDSQNEDEIELEVKGVGVNVA